MWGWKTVSCAHIEEKKVLYSGQRTIHERGYALLCYSVVYTQGCMPNPLWTCWWTAYHPLYIWWCLLRPEKNGKWKAFDTIHMCASGMEKMCRCGWAKFLIMLSCMVFRANGKRIRFSRSIKGVMWSPHDLLHYYSRLDDGQIVWQYHGDEIECWGWGSWEEGHWTKRAFEQVTTPLTN